LLAHPLVGQHELADGLTDRLLAGNTAHLKWADALLSAEAHQNRLAAR
jgi:hypothetical protein